MCLTTSRWVNPEKMEQIRHLKSFRCSCSRQICLNNSLNGLLPFGTNLQILQMCV